MPRLRATGRTKVRLEGLMPKSSDKRVAANQANCKKSTGPRNTTSTRFNARVCEAGVIPTFGHLYGVARLRRAPVAKAKSRYAEDYSMTRGMCGLAPIVSAGYLP